VTDAVIVVPCYNEEKRLDAAAFRSFAPASHRVRFLFVNDGSRNGTAAMLDRLEAADPARFLTLHMVKNSGKAEAVRRGMLRAMELQAEFVGFWDADLATPLDAIGDFCDLLVERPAVEMVFGSRVKLLGRDIQRSAARHYLGRVFATAVSLVLGLGIYDPQCGAKLFRVTPSLRSLLEEPFIARWIFDVEIMARLICQRRGTPRPQAEEVICEYPLKIWHGRAGSRLRRRDFVVAAVDLMRIYRRYLRSPAQERVAHDEVDRCRQ
jgi:glycosyltransferase involved in cell wall biosynthesis